MKACFKCKIKKSREHFYFRKNTKDGLGSFCRACSSIMGREYRLRRIDELREYSRIRDKLPHVRARKNFLRSQRIQDSKTRHKRSAHRKLQRAVDNGKIKKLICQRCGNIKAQAHHEDYSKPLDVIWLCAVHHAERHWQIKNGEPLWSSANHPLGFGLVIEQPEGL